MIRRVSHIAGLGLGFAQRERIFIGLEMLSGIKIARVHQTRILVLALTLTLVLALTLTLTLTLTLPPPPP